MQYVEFLARKEVVVAPKGKEIGLEEINPRLYPFQRQLVQWAVRKGRCAIFADCGLGKTYMQLEWGRLMGGRGLILAPLAVAQQTVAEGAALGIPVAYVRGDDQVGDGISITNYEMAERFDPAQFNSVVLDESSILKNFEGKTRTRLIEMFHQTPYRLCCTATPAPNDITEIANHAEFLGVMTRQEMLATYFVHDDEGWRLKGHAVQEFYQWMASWGMMLKKPSDIGFSDDGYILPDRQLVPVWIEGDAQALANANGQLFLTTLQGIQGRTVARRQTVGAKVERGAGIINDSTEQWIVWCGLNDEGRQLHKVVQGSVLVEGADSLETKVERLTAFLNGDARVLITKTSIAGFGLNLQRCHNMMFVGMSDSYESFYQAIRRCWRFGQKHPVNIQVVLSDIERPILENVLAKQLRSWQMAEQLIGHVQQYEQAELGIAQVHRNGYHVQEMEGEGYRMLMGDCVERVRELPSESIDFSVFSPPFMSLYTYSDSERDMGNSRTDAEFFEHFAFLVSELHRVTKPGRNVAVHVAQVAAKLTSDGFIGLKDFRGQVIDHFVRGGFHYHGDITVDKNPQAQAIRTHSKSLLFAQLKKDSSWLRPGLADYILVFRKPGENQVAIHPDISNDDWITWAHPVWYDISESDTLNARAATTERDERHICPLQLGVIERCIRLWTNKGETVLSPFAGIGSEGHEAIRLGRRFIGVELKESYYNTAVKNLENAVRQSKQGMLL